MKILIVVNDPIALQSVTDLLRDLKHTVDQAGTGADALAQFELVRHDLVLADRKMPEMDGLDLFRRIRSRDANSYPYLILLTPQDGREECRMEMEETADDYLITPVDLEELRARLFVANRIQQMQAALTDTMSHLDAERRRYVELYSSLPIIGMIHELRGGIPECNRACQAAFDVGALQQIHRLGWRALCTQEDAVMLDAAIARAFLGERSDHLEWTYHAANGQDRHYQCSVFPLYAVDETIVAVVSVHTDITDRKNYETRLGKQLTEVNQTNQRLEDETLHITSANMELEQANRQLHNMASTDALTGIASHRTFKDQLVRASAGASRYGSPLSLVVLDIDEFLRYNHAFGHQAGDEMLKTAAAILRHNARASDFVARTGGGVFTIMLTNTDRDGAMASAERFRQAIEDGCRHLRVVTASFGVCTMKGRAFDAETLTGMADQALYYAKQTGRNRVIHIDDIAQ